MEVGVQLELLGPVAVPAIMALNWDFVAHQLASFGTVDRRQPEQQRNRRSGVVSLGSQAGSADRTRFTPTSVWIS